jgi:methylmalonyl-CoA mutase N-terminal domain/subunit
MYDSRFLDKLKSRLAAWDETAAASRKKKSMPRFFTVSGVDIDELFGPDAVAGSAGENYYWDNIGLPGEFPYTRGVHHTMYRTRLWTMRQFAGMGTPRQTNERFHYILKQGGTGLSTAFDLPTLMGYDSDHARSLGEVGKCGVAVDTLADMEIIFDGIDLGTVSTSMTINSPASILLAMYLCVAEKQGVPFEQVRGTLQNDILKEYIAQKEYIFPPRPSIRLITDMMDYCTKHVPQWNTISISGYHIREAGATAVQELAYTLADGFQYVGFLRGDCQVSRRPADIRQADARQIRGEGQAQLAASVPYSDGGSVADRPATREQHRAGRPSGAFGRAGRNAVSAYEFDG